MILYLFFPLLAIIGPLITALCLRPSASANHLRRRVHLCALSWLGLTIASCLLFGWSPWYPPFPDTPLTPAQARGSAIILTLGLGAQCLLSHYSLALFLWPRAAAQCTPEENNSQQQEETPV